MELQFISIMWTDGIPDNEIVMILREVHSALRQALRVLPKPHPINLVNLPEIRPFGYWVLQDSEPGGMYGSAKWYVDQSYDTRQDLFMARRYLNLVLNEPYQHYTPHYDLAIVHHPLYDENTKQIVAGVDVSGRAAILSTHWLKHFPIRHERPIVLRRMVFHYFGRVMGIPFIRKDEPDGCAGPCPMRPAGGLDEWWSLASEEYEENAGYCDSCCRQLAARIASNQLGQN